MSLWTALDEALEAAAITVMVEDAATLAAETILVGNAWDGAVVDGDGNRVDLPLVMILSNQIQHADEDEYACDDAPALTRRYNYLVSAFVAHEERRQARRDAQELYDRLITMIKAIYPLSEHQSGVEAGHSIEWGRAFLEERGKAVLATTSERVWLHAAHVAFDIVSNE